jgi:cobalamin biosynthesis protein CobT
MGNVFMKEKQYDKAVEGYKQALRNDPTDEETRYNLALAQEMLKKKQDEDKKNQDKDDKKDKNEENKEDKKDENEDKKEGDNKDDKKDQGDEKDKENKEGEGDKEDEKKQPNKGDKPEEQKGEQQPRPSQLSPQQVQNLLEAMQNEEKKVQEKMDAKKVKGVKTKNEKDW